MPIRRGCGEQRVEFGERTSVRNDVTLVSDRYPQAAKRFECRVHGFKVVAEPTTSLSDSSLNGPGDGPSFGVVNPSAAAAESV